MGYGINLKQFIREYDWVTEQSSKLIFEFAKTFAVLEAAFERVFAHHGLSISKCNVLVILEKAGEEGMGLSRIGERMLVSKANITGLIDRMENEGLVERRVDRSDRRSVKAVITDKGLAVLELIIPDYRRLNKKILSVLEPAEESKMIEFLQKIQKHMAEENVGEDEEK